MASRTLAKLAFSSLRSRCRFLAATNPLLLCLPNHVDVHSRRFSTRPATSSLNDPAPNWSNRPPKETILLEGCDFEHWLVVVDPPEPTLTRDEIIDYYIQTLAKVLGSEEEAKKSIYSVSTKHYFAFGCIVSEELSYKIKAIEKVRWVLPDSYLDVRNKDYGGEPFIDGRAVPYDPKYHDEWVRNNARANERSKRPRSNFDRSRNFDRRRENMQNRDFQNREAPPVPPQNMTPPSPQNVTPPPPNNGFQNTLPPPPQNVTPPPPNNGFQNTSPPPPPPGHGFQNTSSPLPNHGFQNTPPPPPNYRFQNSMPAHNVTSSPPPPSSPNQGFQGSTPGYQGGNPGYQGGPQTYQGGQQSYQGGGQGYQGGSPSSDINNPGYQGGGPRYQGGGSNNYQSGGGSGYRGGAGGPDNYQSGAGGGGSGYQGGAAYQPVDGGSGYQGGAGGPNYQAGGQGRSANFQAGGPDYPTRDLPGRD